MGSAQLKKEIKQCIDHADDRILKAIHAMLKEYENAADAHELTIEQIAMLEERRTQYRSGKSKTYSVKEIRKMVSGKKGK